jgi:cobalt transporter subunit CbtA
MQAYATVPLILQAETYEGAGHSHDHAPAASQNHSHEAGSAAHSHDDAAVVEDEGWAPADGFERFFYTSMANIVTAIGFGLLLVVASELAGGIAGWRKGLLWGFAGFAVFTLAPTLGLPPELPGMPAAELAARQGWWIGTVAATAGGLALVAFGRSALLVIAGVALIVAPHVIGAPQPDSHDSAVPAELHHNFVVATTVTNLIFWVALGALSGFFRQRIAIPAAGTQESLA